MHFRFWISDFGLAIPDDVDLAVTNVKYTCHPEQSEGSFTGSLRHAIWIRVTQLFRRDPSLPFVL